MFSSERTRWPDAGGYKYVWHHKSNPWRARKAPLPIRKILLTHAHFDHAGSVDDLVDGLPKIELVIGTREARLLAGDFSLEHGERPDRTCLGCPREFKAHAAVKRR